MEELWWAVGEGCVRAFGEREGEGGAREGERERGEGGGGRAPHLLDVAPLSLGQGRHVQVHQQARGQHVAEQLPGGLVASGPQLHQVAGHVPLVRGGRENGGVEVPQEDALGQSRLVPRGWGGRGHGQGSTWVRGSGKDGARKQVPEKTSPDKIMMAGGTKG
jgi:hypothetical protein